MVIAVNCSSMVFGFAPAIVFTVREQNKAVDALAAKSYDFPLGLHVLDTEPFFLNHVSPASWEKSVGGQQISLDTFTAVSFYVTNSRVHRKQLLTQLPSQKA